MFRLSLLLCATMFAAMLIGGRDFGQMRPGLKEALAEAEAEARAEADVQSVLAEAEPVRDVPQVENLVAASFAPQDALPVEAAPQEPVGALTLRLPLMQAQVAEPVMVAIDDSATTATEEPIEASEPAAERVFYVTATSVNVRSGPGTTHEVLGRLSRGEAATVVWTDDTGWAKIRIEGDGIEGFVSLDFLAPDAP
jgi:Bacterial SH3 domain